MKKEEDGGADFDMMIQGKFFNRRQNMDFTDLMWSVLMSEYCRWLVKFLRICYCTELHVRKVYSESYNKWSTVR